MRDKDIIIKDGTADIVLPQAMLASLLKSGVSLTIRREVERRHGLDGGDLVLGKPFEGGRYTRTYDAVCSGYGRLGIAPHLWKVASGLRPYDGCGDGLVHLRRRTIWKRDVCDGDRAFSVDDMRRLYDMMQGRRSPFMAELTGNYRIWRYDVRKKARVVDSGSDVVPLVRLGIMMRLAALCEASGENGRVSFAEPIALSGELSATALVLKKRNGAREALMSLESDLSVVMADSAPGYGVSVVGLPLGAMMALLAQAQEQCGAKWEENK